MVSGEPAAQPATIVKPAVKAVQRSSDVSSGQVNFGCEETQQVKTPEVFFGANARDIQPRTDWVQSLSCAENPFRADAGAEDDASGCANRNRDIGRPASGWSTGGGDQRGSWAGVFGAYLDGDADPVDLSDPWGLAAAPVPVPEPPPAPQQPKTAGLEYLIVVGVISLTAQHALPPLRNEINCIFEAEGGGLRAVSQYLGAPQDLLVDWATCGAISGSKKGRGHSDPIQGPLPEPNPGPNPNQPNGCNPCPPDSPYWEQKGAPGAHGCQSGIHYHWYHYNQSPDCTCHPSREDSCTKPDPPAQPWSPGTKWP